jgi:hypothetical protein
LFKLPGYPSPQADTHELADFAEWLAWEAGHTSKRAMVAYLGRVDDNDHNVGCNDDDDENSDSLDEVLTEIERRESACGSGYPFRLDRAGTVLRHNADQDDHRSVLYRYLLLSTRLNMQKHRDHAGIDGTKLLEEAAAHALKNYLGGTRARAHVFGTAKPGGFSAKIDALCCELREGSGFRSLDDATVQAQDDKLDAVAWVPFSDFLPGQIIIFGQCKTGSNWRDMVAQLQPGAFIKKWMRDPVLINPVRAICISEALDRSRWKGLCVDAGIVFDRCRLVDFCGDLNSDLLDKLARWTSTARDSLRMLTPGHRT